MPTITSGDTAPIAVTLTLNGSAYTLTAGTDTVKAAWCDLKTGSLITAAVAQTSSVTGASWASGIVGVQFDATNMNLLDNYDGQIIALEIQVTKPSGIQTFRPTYTCRRGLIP